MNEPNVPEDDEPTQEIDMGAVFADEELINDLVCGLVPPDERMASVLDAWRREVNTDDLGDPSVDLWREALDEAQRRRREDPNSITTVVIEAVAGLLLLIKAFGHLVQLAVDTVIRLIAQLPWKDPRPWGE